MKKYLLILLFIGSLSATAQELMVRNLSNGAPVENVSIFDLDHIKSSLTNKLGAAQIDVFDESDTLVLQHTSFNPLVISYNDVKSKGFSVYLSERFVKLDEIVVAASKWEQNKEEVPNRIVSINSEEIAFDNPETSADLLGNTGEVFIQKSQQGGGSPMIRGFSANAVLLVVDGVRMNNAIYRGGNLQNVVAIDANAIDNAEVIFGPSSVMYGSDALGGVMDFHTFRPQLSFDKKLISSVNLMARYSSANNERTGHIDVNIGTRKWGFVTSFSNSYFDHLKMGNVGNEDYRRTSYVERIDGQDVVFSNTEPNVQKFSNYNQFNFMQKVRFRPNEKLDFEYGFHYSATSDVPRYDRLIQPTDDGSPKYAEWFYGPQKWMLNTLTTNINTPNAVFTDARFILSYQNYEESRHSRKFNADKYLNQVEKVGIFALNADFNKDLNEKNFFFYGLEFVYNKVKSTADYTSISSDSVWAAPSRYPDGKNNYITGAAYFNYKLNLNPKLTFLAGIRYTYVNADSQIEDTTFYDFPFQEIKLSTNAINGSIGVAYRPGRQWQINANLASGFRAPNIDDLAKVFDSEPGSVVVPNPDLRPEYSYNLDVGLIKKFGDKVKIDLSLFYTLLRDAIVRRDYTFNGQDSIMYNGELSKVQAMVNASSAYIYGVNFLLDWDISKLFAFGTRFTYMTGEDNEGYALRHVSPLFGSSFITFRWNDFTAEVNAAYNGSIAYKNLAPSERSKTYIYATDENGNPYSPAWWTLNFRSSYAINKHLVFDVAFENILNKRYRPYSSGIAAPGLNFRFTLRAMF